MSFDPDSPSKVELQRDLARTLEHQRLTEKGAALVIQELRARLASSESECARLRDALTGTLFALHQLDSRLAGRLDVWTRFERDVVLDSARAALSQAVRP